MQSRVWIGQAGPSFRIGPAAGVGTLALVADRAVFSGAEDPDAEVDRYWTSALEELDRLAARTSRWRRIVNRFVLRRAPRARRTARPKEGSTAP